MSDTLPDATCKREIQAQRERRTENGERKWKRKRIKRSCAKILIKSQKRLTVKYAASRPHIRVRTKKRGSEGDRAVAARNVCCRISCVVNSPLEIRRMLKSVNSSRLPRLRLSLCRDVLSLGSLAKVSQSNVTFTFGATAVWQRNKSA